MSCSGKAPPPPSNPEAINPRCLCDVPAQAKIKAKRTNSQSLSFPSLRPRSPSPNAGYGFVHVKRWGSGCGSKVFGPRVQGLKNPDITRLRLLRGLCSNWVVLTGDVFRKSPRVPLPPRPSSRGKMFKPSPFLACTPVDGADDWDQNSSAPGLASSLPTANSSDVCDLHIERLAGFNSQLPPQARSKQPRSRRPQAGSKPLPGRLQESFREGEASQ